MGLAIAVLLGAGLSLWSADGSSSSTKAVIIIGASLVVTLCTYAAREACHRASGFDVSSGLTRVLLIGSMDEMAERAGWLAIVDGDPNAPQSSWLEARESRKLSYRQAVASSITVLPGYILLRLLPATAAANQLGATASEWKPPRVNVDSIDLA